MAFLEEFVISGSPAALLRFSRIPVGLRRPPRHTITASSAAVAGASTINLTASPAIELQHNAVIPFARTEPGFTVSNAAGYARGVNQMTVAQITGNAAMAKGSKFKFDAVGHDQIYTLANDTAETATEIGFVPGLRQGVSDGDVVVPIVEAIVDLPDTREDLPNDIVSVGGTVVAVPVASLSGAIAVNTTSEVYEMRELLGLLDPGVSATLQTTEIFDHKTVSSGFIGTYTAGGSSKTLTLTGNIRTWDRGLELANRIVNDPVYTGSAVWAELINSNQTYSEGVGYFTSYSTTDNVPNPSTYNMGFGFSGSFLSYNIANHALYAVA